MTYMFILKCALKLVEEIILYYDARSKKHQTTTKVSQALQFAISPLITAHFSVGFVVIKTSLQIPGYINYPSNN